MAREVGIGTEVGGYRIEALIGRGGMGAVYLAEQQFPKRKVALKVLSPDLAEDEGFRERFVHESNVAASIDHPNIIPIHAAGEAGGRLYLAMRYVRGTDLRTLISKEGPLGLEQTASIVGAVAGALDEAHAEGLVHRDVKPANILIASGRGPESSGHVYLSDFGLTKRVISTSGLTKTGQFMGTVGYVSPEQIRGDPVDGLADVYSLGCVAYECLSGEPVFPRDEEVAVMFAHLQDPPPSVASRRPELPAGIDSVIARAMAKSPTDRYQTCGEFAKALGRVGQAPAEPAPPTGGTRRTRLVAAGAVLAAVAVAIVAVVLVLSGHGGTPKAAPSPSTTVPAPIEGVLRLDPATNRVVARIRLDEKPRRSIVVGEGGVWLVHGRFGAAKVAHVDPATNRVAAVISGNGVSAALNVAVGAQAVWILDGSYEGTVGRFNPATNELLKLIRLIPRQSGLGGTLTGETFAYGSLWVVDSKLGAVFRFDPATNQIVARIPVGGSPIDVAAGEEGIWVTDTENDRLYRIDPARNELAATIPLTGGATRIAAGAGGVWALNSSDGIVTKIDPGTNLAVRPIKVGKSPSGVVVGGGAVWVTNLGDGTVTRINPDTYQVQSITVGGYPAGVTFGFGSVWIAQRTTSSISS
jgi:YVTN family beta-propeller protein